MPLTSNEQWVKEYFGMRDLCFLAHYTTKAGAWILKTTLKLPYIKKNSDVAWVGRRVFWPSLLWQLYLLSSPTF